MKNTACLGENRNAYRVLVGNLKERDHLKDLGIDGRVTLQQYCRNSIRGHRLDYLAQKKGRAAGSYKHSNKPSGSVKCGELLD
jgi:hypothetical protein